VSILIDSPVPNANLILAQLTRALTCLAPHGIKSQKLGHGSGANGSNGSGDRRAVDRSGIAYDTLTCAAACIARTLSPKYSYYTSTDSESLSGRLKKFLRLYRMANRAGGLGSTIRIRKWLHGPRHPRFMSPWAKHPRHTVSA
jgi:hypothetical protein